MGLSHAPRRHRVLRTLVALTLIGGATGISVPEVRAAVGTISGTVTAGGQPVPAGSVQVAFVKYTKNPSYPCTAGQPASNALSAVTTGANGHYSMELDTDFYYKIIFKPLTTAPRTAVFRWYTSSTSAGTTVGYSSNPLATQATCITNLTTAGLSGISLSTSGASVQATGTISTASGIRTSNATLAFTPTTTCYFNLPHGYVARPNEQGFWEIAGIDTNQSGLYLQVVTPPGFAALGTCNPVYFAKRTSSGYELIPSADVAACGADCRFDLATTDLANVDLRLPVMGRISGTISGTSGPVGAGEVCAIAYRDGANAMNSHSMRVGGNCTNSSGQYSIDLTYDNYRLQFVAQPNTQWISEWWDNVSLSAGYGGSTLLCVKPAGANCSTSKTADPILAAGHSISGRLTDADGNAVVGVQVAALQRDPDMGFWSQFGYGSTDSNGNYTVMGLPSGTYTVSSNHPDHGQIWLGGTRESAIAFSVTGNVTGKNLAFPRGYSASGNIALQGESEARVCVSAFLVSDSGFGWGEHAGGNCFTAPGGWQIKGLKAGNYRFRFDAQTGNLRSTFLGGTDYSQATVMPITNSNLTGVDITLAAGKTITGKITNGDAGVPNVCVTAFKVSESEWSWGTWAGGSCTATNGEYQIRGIEAGTYRLRVEPPNSTDFAPGFLHSDGTPVRQMINASLVMVSANDATTVAPTQALQSSPKITGKVVDSGTDTAGICVDAIRKIDDYSWGEHSATSCTGPDGKISLRGLAAGQYRLRVNPQTGNYQSGWFRSGTTTTQDNSSASVVTVALTDVAIGNISLVSGKKVTGRITDGTNPVVGACVGALKDDGSTWGQWSGSGCTNFKGEFTIRGLDPTSSFWFRVDVWVGDFKPGFVASDGSTSSSTTGIASRPATADIALGDITLATAPSIKGTVTSGESTKEGNVCVTAMDAATMQWVTSTCSAPNGSFALRGLTPGSSYKLTWWTPNTLLVSGWYKQANAGPTAVDNQADATPIEVTSAGVTGLAIRLANGGTISGSLTTDFCVAAWTEPETNASQRGDASAVTCAIDGKYELKGLKQNTDYFLQVFKKDGTAVTQTSPSVNSAVRTATTQNITAS